MLLTCSFGHMVPPGLLGRFGWERRLNVHPSLLPALRGAAPLQWAIARRITHTGVSVQSIEPHRFDAGRILAQSTAVRHTPHPPAPSCGD